MAQEKWRDVVGYEGLYIVSDQGNVMSLPRRKGKGQSARNHYGQMLSNRPTPNGYLKVTLFKNGEAKQYSVHRLVMEAFVGPSELQVNHINEVKTDNRLENLEYMTGFDNTRYTCSKPVESYDLDTGETIKRYASASDVRVDGFEPGAISSVCYKKYGYKSHHGVGWRFADAKHPREDCSGS